MLLIVLSTLGLPQTGGGRADPISAQAARELLCGRVVAVSCTSPASPGTLLIAPGGADRNWRLVIPPEQRHLFGERLENQYEEQMVCVEPAVLAGGRNGFVTIRDPSQLAIKNPAEPVESLPDEVSRTCDPDVQLPVIVHQVHAQMTADAMRAKVNGSVVLRGVVDRNGAVVDVRVVQSLEPSLDAEACEAFSRWTFRPGRRGGEPVPMAVTVEMTYTTPR